jgi:hypothetical protein
VNFVVDAVVVVPDPPCPSLIEIHAESEWFVGSWYTASSVSFGNAPNDGTQLYRLVSGMHVTLTKSAVATPVSMMSVTIHRPLRGLSTYSLANVPSLFGFVEPRSGLMEFVCVPWFTHTHWLMACGPNGRFCPPSQYPSTRSRLSESSFWSGSTTSTKTQSELTYPLTRWPCRFRKYIDGLAVTTSAT